ncbi:hypothetical protein RvY_10834 [Ramazzottius varieornatus]|uniref:Transmembrane protein n=1 Tax=Ramazzottius varieornatus TaxID=947166 RepID=A0A1D1VN19_RAMVA|nr:hypothetical protein RvY_10834 [Ramazzottius varieornatus]
MLEEEAGSCDPTMGLGVVARTFAYLYLCYFGAAVAHHFYGFDDRDISYRTSVPKRLNDGTLKPEDLDERGRPPPEPGADVKVVKNFFRTLFSRPEGPIMPWIRGERAWADFPDNYEEPQENYLRAHPDFVPKK